MKILKNKKTILIITLILVEITAIFLMYKSSNNRNTLLDNVNLKEQINNMKGIAIMLEQDDGTYQESTSKAFPTDMKYNEEKSGCIDNFGNKIEGSLIYENGIANVTTSNTSYCYLYFDIDSINNMITSDDVWQSTLEGDGYRFVGTDPANYICFGTTDTSTCTGNTDLYMYRIIGIFEDSSGEKHLKLIKKEALNTAYAWHSDSSTDTDWNESDLYKGINGSYFVSNTEYSYMQDLEWYNKIATWDYTMTDTLTYESDGPDYYNLTVGNVYLHEMNRSGKTSTVGEWTTVSVKIGLMYASDYQLSLGSNALNYTSSDNNALLKTGWMHISNNDSASLSTTTAFPPSTLEWTMSRYGFDGSRYYAWLVDSNGFVAWYDVNDARSVRPVFYLTSDVTISGEGTSTNPFIIS